MLPSYLKFRVAMVVLVGVFLVPIGLSAMRGITHVLTCREQVATPFQVLVEDGFPIITGSTVISADQPPTLCGGLAVNMRVAAMEGNQVGVTIPITNTSGADWYGTVQLSVGGVRIPIGLGKVAAGETAERTIPLRVPDEGTIEFDGSLLIGP